MSKVLSLIKGWNKYKSDWEGIYSSGNALKGIDTVHERIHAGKCWYFTGQGVHTSAIPNRFSLLSVGALPFHLRTFGVKTDNGIYSGTLYEAPFTDVNSLGVQVTLNNLKRTSDNMPSTDMYANPFIDVNSLGAYLDHGAIFESTGGAIKSVSGEISTIVTEWILKPNTNYAAFFVNSSGNDVNYIQHMLGYEND